MQRRRLYAVLPCFLLLASCSNSPTGPGGRSQVQIRLTDAPSAVIATAEVWISHVYLQGGEGGRVDLFNDRANPRVYDLLQLRNGVEADLTGGGVDVDAGAYQELRLVVDSARVTLVNGMTFADGSNMKRLMVPSGEQTGIKVQLSQPIEVDAGERAIVLVDFDVDRNFVMQGSENSPNGIEGFLFTPVLTEKSRASEQAR